MDEQIQKAFVQGLSCLKNLTLKGKKRTYDKIQERLDFFGRVEITCPDNWTSESLAQAESRDFHSTDSLRIEVDSSELEHDLVRGDYFAGLILHEMLHFPGYDHTATIDYAYACEYHCFPPKEFSMKQYGKESLENARDICNGKYDDPDDFEYLRRIGNMQMVIEPLWKVILERIHAAILRHPKSNLLRLMLAQYASNSPAYPVSYALSANLKRRYAGTALTPKEKEWFDNLAVYEKEYKTPNEFREPAKHLAFSLMSFYDGNQSAAESALKAISLPTARKKMKQEDFDSMKRYFDFMIKLESRM